MFPILCRLGPLTFHTYGLFVALGVLLGCQMAIFLAAFEGYERKNAEQELYSLLVYFILGGIIGGRMLYVCFTWEEFQGDFFAVFKIWQGGLVSFGGLIGALIGFCFWARKNKIVHWRKVLDWLAPSMAFGHALGRFGCFFAGCCYGKPTDKPWGVLFNDPDSLAPIGIRVHPTQIYEAIFLFALAVFLTARLFHKVKNRKADGMIFTEYLGLYALGRFLIEFLRGDLPPVFGLNQGQWLSVIAFIAGLVFNRIFASQNPIRTVKR